MFSGKIYEDRLLFPSADDTARASSLVNANKPANGLMIINNNAQAFGVTLTLTFGLATANYYFTIGSSTSEGPLTISFDDPVIQGIELTPISNPDTDTTGLNNGTNPVTGFTAANTAADCIVRLKVNFE